MSMLLSAQAMTLPASALELQVARPYTSPGLSLRSHTLKWASSPTKACVASNPPPSVSCGGATVSGDAPLGGPVCPLGAGTPPQSPAVPDPYLLLAQHQDALGFDGVVGGQVLAVSRLRAVLVRFPHAVPRGPGDTDVVPLAVVDGEGQLGHLRAAEGQGGARGGPPSPSPPPRGCTLSLMRISMGLLPHSMSTSSLACPGTA